MAIDKFFFILEVWRFFNDAIATAKLVLCIPVGHLGFRRQ